MAATAYVSLFRPSQYFGSLGRFGVFVDGQQVGKVANGERAQFEVAPGRHELTVKPGLRRTKLVSFEVAPGETARYRLDSVGSVAQMVLAIVYLFTGNNYWLSEERQ